MMKRIGAVTTVSKALLLSALVLLAVSGGCRLFEPREPEPPTQSSGNFVPPTLPEIVISNLQNAIAEKNLENYMSCFADPTRSSHVFSFNPAASFTTLRSPWAYSDERNHFQELITQGLPAGFSSLILRLKFSSISSDSVIYSYDYTFTFETKPENTFPSTASGNLQFTLGLESNNWWVIYYWKDNDDPNTPGITWSAFKGKFSRE